MQTRKILTMTSENNESLKICLVDSRSNPDPNITTRWSVWRKILLDNFTEVYVVSSNTHIRKFTSEDGKENAEGKEVTDPKIVPQLQVAFIHLTDNKKIWKNINPIKPQQQFWFWFSSETITESLSPEIEGLPICRTTDIDGFNITDADIKGVINYVTGRLSESELPLICSPRKPSDPDYDWHQFENLGIKTAAERKQAKQDMFQAFSYLREPPKE